MGFANWRFILKELPVDKSDVKCLATSDKMVVAGYIDGTVKTWCLKESETICGSEAVVKDLEELEIAENFLHGHSVICTRRDRSVDKMVVT